VEHGAGQPELVEVPAQGPRLPGADQSYTAAIRSAGGLRRQRDFGIGRVSLARKLVMAVLDSLLPQLTICITFGGIYFLTNFRILINFAFCWDSDFGQKYSFLVVFQS